LISEEAQSLVSNSLKHTQGIDANMFDKLFSEENFKSKMSVNLKKSSTIFNPEIVDDLF